MGSKGKRRGGAYQTAGSERLGGLGDSGVRGEVTTRKLAEYNNG